MSAKIAKSDAEWRAQLTPLQYNVTRKMGTEPPFSGEYCASSQKGLYRCVCCRAALFGSDAKFDSGDGWPAFTEPTKPECLRTAEDLSWFEPRTEVRCAACDAHLGHLVDAPGLRRRYCINSAALELETRN